MQAPPPKNGEGFGGGAWVRGYPFGGYTAIASYPGPFDGPGYEANTAKAYKPQSNL